MLKRIGFLFLGVLVGAVIGIATANLFDANEGKKFLYSILAHAFIFGIASMIFGNKIVPFIRTIYKIIVG